MLPFGTDVLCGRYLGGEFGYKVDVFLRDPAVVHRLPDDKGIKFKRLEPYRAAVITFPGRMNEGLANKKGEELKSWLDKKGLLARSNFIAAQYDPPWIPGLMRKNEVIVEI